MNSSLKDKARLLFEAVLTAILFTLQSIVYGGWANQRNVHSITALFGHTRDGSSESAERHPSVVLREGVHIW